MTKKEAILELMEYLDWELHAIDHETDNPIELPSDEVLNLALGLELIDEDDED